MSNVNEERMEILRGDIIMCDLSPTLSSEMGGIRPCLVIQNNMGNKYSRTVTIVPLTSVISKKAMPTHIHVKGGDFGLEKDSLILCEAIRTVAKDRFRNKLGSVDGNTLLKVENAIMVNLGFFS